jgi:6-phosphogluconate dehydrogenase
MQLGMVGLGRMGGNMVQRLLRHGHDCVVFDRDPARVKDLSAQGAAGSAALEELVRQLEPPRHVWVMLPAGGPTEQTITALAGHLAAGDTVIDGGNTFFKDDVRRARELVPRRIDYVDVGTSGGVWGIERGYCLMIGGPAAAVRRLAPIFESLAPGEGDIGRTPGREALQSTAERGFLHCGPAGAGHFVKMIHNGIEYGLMQAYAEGFDIMKNAASTSLEEGCRYDLPVADIAELWRRGSVVGSWLLDLTAAALAGDSKLERYTGFVQDSGEGRWAVAAAVEEAVPAEVLTAALFARFRSRQAHTFAEKVLSAMREQFGGHREPGQKPDSA